MVLLFTIYTRAHRAVELGYQRMRVPSDSRHGQTLAEQHILQFIHVGPILQLISYRHISYASFEILSGEKSAAGRGVWHTANIQRTLRVHFARASVLGQRNNRRLTVNAQRYLFGVIHRRHIVPLIVAQRELRPKIRFDTEWIAVA